MLNAQGLLQGQVSSVRLLGDQQKGQHTLQPVPVAEYLEYVDERTGFTPLLVAVFYHSTEAAKLVSCVCGVAPNQGKASKTFSTPLNRFKFSHAMMPHMTIMTAHVAEHHASHQCHTFADQVFCVFEYSN